MEARGLLTGWVTLRPRRPAVATHPSDDSRDNNKYNKLVLDSGRLQVALPVAYLTTLTCAWGPLAPTPVGGAAEGARRSSRDRNFGHQRIYGALIYNYGSAKLNH